MDYFTYIPVQVEESAFAQPSVCAGVTATMPLSGNDLFLQAAADTSQRIKNMKKIASFNQNKDFTFRVTPNKFINMDHQTFKRVYTGHRKSNTVNNNIKYKVTDGTPLPH